MIDRFISVAMMSVVLCLAGCGRATPPDKPVFINLAVNNILEYEKAPERFVDSGVHLFVNGNFCKFLRSGSSAGPIEKFLKPGRNTLTLKGDSEFPVELSIVEFPYEGASGNEGRCIVDQSWQTITNGGDYKLTFDLGNRSLLPPFQDDTPLPERVRIEQDLTVAVSNLYDMCRRKDHESYLDATLKGLAIYNPTRHARWKKKLSSMLKHLDVKPPNKNLRFIHGNNLVFVYSKLKKKKGIPPSMVLLESRTGDTVSVPGLHFAYIDGKWIVW